jgi:predicted ATPase
LLTSTRQRYHAQLAQALEARSEAAETQPELLAHHYTEAGLAEQSVGYWQRAGERSNTRSAYVEAVAHLTKGLEVLQTLPNTSGSARHELDMQLTLALALMVTKGSGAPERGQVLARARELCRQVGDTLQLLKVLSALAGFHRQRGKLQTARELSEQRLTLVQDYQDPTFRVGAHVDLGVCLFFMGELTSTQAHLAQAIALSASQHDPSLDFRYGADPMVLCLGYMAQTLWMLGYPDQALTRMHEMLTYAQESSHPFSLARALYFAAWLHQFRRERAAAQGRAEAALALMTEHGFRSNLGYATLARGWALAVQGQREDGIAQMHQGLAAERAMGAMLGESWSLAPLAEAYGADDQAEEGLRLLAEALAWVDTTGEHFYEAEVYRLMGELLLRQAVPDEPQAEGCFHQALAVARQQQAKLWELRSAMSLGQLWQQQGKHAEARALLAPIYDWFTERFDTPDLQEAKALLEELGT